LPVPGRQGRTEYQHQGPRPRRSVRFNPRPAPSARTAPAPKGGHPPGGHLEHRPRVMVRRLCGSTTPVRNQDNAAFSHQPISPWKQPLLRGTSERSTTKNRRKQWRRNAHPPNQPKQGSTPYTVFSGVAVRGLGVGHFIAQRRPAPIFGCAAQTSASGTVET